MRLPPEIREHYRDFRLIVLAIVVASLGLLAMKLYPSAVIVSLGGWFICQRFWQKELENATPIEWQEVERLGEEEQAIYWHWGRSNLLLVVNALLCAGVAAFAMADRFLG